MDFPLQGGTAKWTQHELSGARKARTQMSAWHKHYGTLEKDKILWLLR